MYSTLSLIFFAIFITFTTAATCPNCDALTATLIANGGTSACYASKFPTSLHAPACTTTVTVGGTSTVKQTTTVTVRSTAVRTMQRTAHQSATTTTTTVTSSTLTTTSTTTTVPETGVITETLTPIATETDVITNIDLSSFTTISYTYPNRKKRAVVTFDGSSTTAACYCLLGRSPLSISTKTITVVAATTTAIMSKVVTSVVVQTITLSYVQSTFIKTATSQTTSVTVGTEIDTSSTTTTSFIQGPTTTSTTLTTIVLSTTSTSIEVSSIGINTVTVTTDVTALTTQTISPTESISGTVLIEVPLPITTTTSVAGAVEATTTAILPNGQTEITVTKSCNHAGFNYAFYDNPFVDSDASYGNFDPAYFSTAPVLASGTHVASDSGWWDAPPYDNGAVSIYDSQIDPTQKALMITFYLYSDIDQTISFFPETWDVEYVYVGDNALAGYSKNNWDGRSLDWYSTGLRFQVTANSYTPIRLVFAYSTQSAEHNKMESRLDIYGTGQKVYQFTC